MKHERLEQARRVSLVGLTGEGNKHGRDPTIIVRQAHSAQLQARPLSIYAFSIVKPASYYTYSPAHA